MELLICGWYIADIHQKPNRYTVSFISVTDFACLAISRRPIRALRIYGNYLPHFLISHNAPYLPPQILHKHCFQFLLGPLYLGEMKNKGFWTPPLCWLWFAWSSNSFLVVQYNLMNLGSKICRVSNTFLMFAPTSTSYNNSEKPSLTLTN